MVEFLDDKKQWFYVCWFGYRRRGCAEVFMYLTIEDADTLVEWCMQAYPWGVDRQQITRLIAVVPTPSITKRATSAKATVIKPDIKHIITTSPELGKNFCINSLSNLYSYELVPRTKSVMGVNTTTRRCSKPQALPEPDLQTTIICQSLNTAAPAFFQNRPPNPFAPVSLSWRLNPKAIIYHPRRRPSTTDTHHKKTPAYPKEFNNTANAATVTTYPRDELYNLIDNAAITLANSQDWVIFFTSQQHNQNNWGNVKIVAHKAQHLLSYYKHHGVPVTMHTQP